MSSGRRIAFLCLGVMGGSIAGHLARAGHRVTVYNRTTARAESWLATHAAFDVSLAVTPAEAARGAEVVFACTGADPDLREITLGRRSEADEVSLEAGVRPEGAFVGMSPGSIFVDHTTTSAALARELADEAAARGIGFLDAPVSGGQSGAEAGILTVMLGGHESIYRQVVPLLELYARKHSLIGPSGHGQLAKMVNQICIAGLLEALSEGIHFGEAAGLDMTRVIDVIARGAAGSWQMDHRAETMLLRRFDFGFAVDWMRKDLGMALDEAGRRGLSLPVTEVVDRRYAEIQRRGGGRLDTSSLILALEGVEGSSSTS